MALCSKTGDVYDNSSTIPWLPVHEMAVSRCSRAGLTFSMQSNDPNDEKDGGGYIAGCTACTAIVVADRVADSFNQGCSTASKVAKIAVKTDSLKDDYEGACAVGRRLLQSPERASLLQDSELMSEIPELEALRKGVQIERFMEENPEVTTKIGLYLAKTNREKFARLFVDDWELRSPTIKRSPLTQELLKKKAVFHGHAEKTVHDLATALRSYDPPITTAMLQKEARVLNHVAPDGSDVQVSIEGLFVEIRVKKDSYTLIAQVDPAAVIASAGATALTFYVVERDFYYSTPRAPTGNTLRNLRTENR